jgi:alcohol dehydrogenase class IV
MWEPQGFYTTFLLDQPTLLVGEDAVRGLFNYPVGKVAVIYGSGFKEENKPIFLSSLKGFTIRFIRKSWGGEPTLEGLQGTLRELEEFRPDTLIAVGGGSVIDGTKLCRLLYEFPFIDTQSPKFSFLEWKTKFIAVPTTIGSGAEASSAAVLQNQSQKRKEMVVAHALRPSIVMFIPSFIAQSNPALIASSALDAISHIVEGYVSNISNPMAELWAEQGLNIFRQELLQTTPDYMRLQYAGYLGGIVQNHCLVGAAHAFAHQLAGEGYGHSEAIALLLPHVIRQNMQQAEVKSRYENLFLHSGFQGIGDALDFIGTLRMQAKPRHTEADLRALLQAKAHDETFLFHVMEDQGGKGNPVGITPEYILQFIQNY